VPGAAKFIAALIGDTPRDDDRILEAADRLIQARADGLPGKDAAAAAVVWYKNPAAPIAFPAALAAAREASLRGLGQGNNPRWRGGARLIVALLGGWATSPDMYGYNESRIERFNPADYE